MEKMEKEQIKNDWIDWYEFQPQGDTFILKTLPIATTKETEGGLILSIHDSKVVDRPNAGIVMSTGPDARYKVGDFLFFDSMKGFDLGMIRKESDAEYSYLLLYTDAIIGQKVKDVRK